MVSKCFISRLLIHSYSTIIEGYKIGMQMKGFFEHNMCTKHTYSALLLILTAEGTQNLKCDAQKARFVVHIKCAGENLS